MKYRTAKLPVFILFLLLVPLNLPAKTVFGVRFEGNSKKPLQDYKLILIDTINIIHPVQTSEYKEELNIIGSEFDIFKVKTGSYGYIKASISPNFLERRYKFDSKDRKEVVPNLLKDAISNVKNIIPYLDSIQFYERRSQGLGYYVTWNDFKDRGLLNVYDIFRGIPGLIVKNNRVFFVRYAVSSFIKTEPKPSIYVDGMLINDNNIEWLPPESVDAVEVYNHLYAPIQYNRGRLGGVILIWTKN